VQQKHKSGIFKFIKLAQLICLILIAHLFFPLPAAADQSAGILLIPVFLLFAIFLSALLAAIVKLRLVKTKLGQKTELSLRDLLGLTILEGVVMALFIIPALLSIPRDIALGIVRYALWLSDEIAIWYFQIFSSFKYFLFWCVVLFITAPINLIFALLPNLELLRDQNEGFLGAIKQPKKIMYAGLLGLIAPVLLSIMILFFVSIPEFHDSRSSKVNATLLNDKKVLNELMIKSASVGYPMLMAAFLRKGADVNAKDKSGFTALMGAVFPEVERALFSEVQIELVRLLLENGADVNAKTKDGRTALMRACTYNNEVEVTKVLLENGADINEKDERGKTALMQAVFFVNNQAVVRLLLENGADVNAKDKYGQTALLMASRRPYQFREILIKYGAKE